MKKEVGYKEIKRELKLITQAEFFRAVAAAAGHMDEVSVRTVYNAILDVTYKELFEKGALRLPSFLDIKMVRSKPRSIRNKWMDKTFYRPAHHSMRAAPVREVRNFIKDFEQANPGVIKEAGDRIKEMREEGLL